jgi:hypothetical protein
VLLIDLSMREMGMLHQSSSYSVKVRSGVAKVGPQIGAISAVLVRMKIGYWLNLKSTGLAV